MEHLKQFLSIALLVVSKALLHILILSKATLMAIYQILAGVFGWEKEKRNRSNKHFRYHQRSKNYRSHKTTYVNKRKSSADSKSKGDKFEAYIVKSLNQNYFKVKEWRGDKYVDGRYAESNMLPDLEIEYSHNSVTSRFAIECKYRTSVIDDAVEIAKPYQLDNYSKFSEEKDMPVFIALGLGGYPNSPDEEFIIPLDSINNNLISYGELRQFRRRHQGNLFYDCRMQELR
ncbi:hypothetical protein [Pontibacter mangrovi]|uniref:Uncharacterized protein n=1 Tax=Pontibacter mangrovi TaxID=2589816 RepID=A0A501W8L7_9BACT|nr:hypothetical protein [Pontibacter mangrovi]TPE43621.1 hypothetical protein FJM65_12760 [Pontibacter mangrovi]